MIKNYKLVLIGVLTLCFGLHAMDYIQQTSANNYSQGQKGDEHFKLGTKPNSYILKSNQPKTNQVNKKDNDKIKNNNQCARKTRRTRRKKYICQLKPFKQLIIKGFPEKPSALNIKLKNSTNNKGFYLEYTKKYISLIDKFLTIKNEPIEVKTKSFSSAITEYEKAQRKLDLQKQINYWNQHQQLLEDSASSKEQKLVISSNNFDENEKLNKIFFILYTPKNWEVDIQGKDAKIVGCLSNIASIIYLENCKVSLDGKLESSNNHLKNSYYYLNNSTFNKTNNSNKLIVTGNIKLDLENSYFRCWTDPENYYESKLIKNGLRGGDYHVVCNPLNVRGSARNKSTTCFYQKYTSPHCMEYDESSNSTYIPDENCIRSYNQ